MKSNFMDLSPSPRSVTTKASLDEDGSNDDDRMQLDEEDDVRILSVC